MVHEREQSGVGIMSGPRRAEQHTLELLRQEEIFDQERIIIPTAFVPGNGSGGGFDGGQDFGPIVPSAPMSMFEWMLDTIPAIVVGIVMGTIVLMGAFAIVFLL